MRGGERTQCDPPPNGRMRFIDYQSYLVNKLLYSVALSILFLSSLSTSTSEWSLSSRDRIKTYLKFIVGEDH